jgi:hypothetical protein
MLSQRRNPLLLLLFPHCQAGLCQRDVIIGVIQPDFRDCYDRARQLIRHHTPEGLVESSLLAVKQVVVRAALPGVPADLRRHSACLKGYI